jgi:hypothetical protein
MRDPHWQVNELSASFRELTLTIISSKWHSGFGHSNLSPVFHRVSVFIRLRNRTEYDVQELLVQPPRSTVKNLRWEHGQEAARGPFERPS